MTPDHGTLERYRQGCGCSACIIAAARADHPTRPKRSDRNVVKVTDGELRVDCWCRAEIVPVPQSEVMACLTRSCGSERCGPELLTPR